jgi:hypothetical protein
VKRKSGQRNERWRLNRRYEIGNGKIRGKSEKEIRTAERKMEAEQERGARERKD